MIRSQGKLRCIATADLRFGDDGVPHSDAFADSYFSRDGGHGESAYVFLEGNRLAERMAAPVTPVLSIAELGFGTGLNFLSTWQLFEQFAPPELRLHYWSVDAHPLRRSALDTALTLWPQLDRYASALSKSYPPPIDGVHRRMFAGGRVVLDCVWADASSALADLASYARQQIDAWFLDGFAPSRNADMWTPEIFQLMARCSRTDATFASYSAAGSVRRGLEQAGFNVRKRPGYASKRECIHGELAQASKPAKVPMTPWDLSDAVQGGLPARVMVIGAGLAGAHVAAALARRNIPVEVLDAGAAAEGASGNAQGVLFTRLSHERSSLSDFSLLAHGYAARLYQSLFEDQRLRENIDGSLNGCFQAPGPRGNYSALAETLRALPEIAQTLSAQEAAATLGARPSSEGLWQPAAGWLSPPAVCRVLLDSQWITLKEHCGRLTLQHTDGHWRALTTEGELAAEAEYVVIATGISSAAFLDLPNWLPLKAVRGQTTVIPDHALPALAASYCHRGYIAPPAQGEYCIGASFSPGDEGRELRVEDHRHNLEALAAAIPAWKTALAALDPAALEGRAELRAATPDYLPMAGPVPCMESFNGRYAPLRYDARQIIDTPAECWPACYLSAGYGSRGLSYAALCGELVASQLCGEVAPLARELHRAVSPARFLHRSLLRRAAAPGNG